MAQITTHFVQDFVSAMKKISAGSLILDRQVLDIMHLPVSKEVFRAMSVADKNMAELESEVKKLEPSFMPVAQFCRSSDDPVCDALREEYQVFIHKTLPILNKNKELLKYAPNEESSFVRKQKFFLWNKLIRLF